jgi:Ca2+-binding EF-hand superfamily protein
MSISAVDSSGVSSTLYGLQKRTGSAQGSGLSSDDFASSILAQDDADGDGLLSLGETPLDEERFTAIDSDGDDFISAEELSADAQAHMDEKNQMMGQLTLRMQGVNTDEMAASIFEKDDADGDGLLSMAETPLDEDKFNAIDADGDGFISVEELSADMQENMDEGMPTISEGTQQQAAAASGSDGSSESESEEEYDEYDLNKDGTVSLDELLQAFREGDSSLSSLLQSMDGNAVSSLTQRLAMEAYEAQMA